MHVSEADTLAFHSIELADAVAFRRYRDAYGQATNAETFLRQLESTTEDEREEGINDGLYSHITHQYTMYSVTPVFIYRLAKRWDKIHPEIKDTIVDFVRNCGERGSGGMYLTSVELIKIRIGWLKLFRVEEAAAYFLKSINAAPLSCHRCISYNRGITKR